MKIKVLLFVLLALTLLVGCTSASGAGAHTEGEYSMIGTVTELGEKILIEAEESETAFGPYLVITSDATVYTDAEGNPLRRADIAVGQRVKITYSGQVMLSYPPQIVAHSITVL